MKAPLLIAITLLTAALLAAASACDDEGEDIPGDATELPPQPVSSETAPPEGATHTPQPFSGRTNSWPQSFATPIVRSEGYYMAPAYDPSNGEEIDAAIDRAAELEVFHGTIGGFLFLDPEEFAERWPFPCLSTQASNEAVEPDEVPFGVTYFPPGTIEETKPLLRVCADGAVYYTFRTFKVGPAEFTVAYTGGDLSIHNDSHRVGYVKEASLHGRTGVIAETFLPHGAGASAASWPSGNGYMSVRSFGLPVEELMKIVEGVTCADC
jgi:hypothetical protein